MWFSAVFPTLYGDHPPGETWLVTYSTGWPGRWNDEIAAAESTGWDIALTDTTIRISRGASELFAMPVSR
jgi:hypothetical protein